MNKNQKRKLYELETLTDDTSHLRLNVPNALLISIDDTLFDSA